MIPTYEYRLLQLPESSSISQANNQIRRLADEGWEPLLMSGDAQVNILFRRDADISSAVMAEAAATAEAPA